MIRRSWVIRAVPAAAMIRAPAMAARNSATASDRRRCAPRKLMLTACAFWMMKIITTIRPAKAAMRLVRMPLIRVCILAVLSAGAGGGAGGGLEPLAEGGGNGSVLVVPRGDTGGSVMAVLPSPVRAGRRNPAWHPTE